MAKGDSADARSQIQAARTNFQPALQQYTNSLYPQQQQNWNNYNAAGQQQVGDYLNLMGSYGNLAQNPGISYSTDPTMANAMQGYTGFSQTGGYSPQDLQDIRARAVSSVRSQYQTAMDNLSRQKNIQGGYSPNYDAALAQMTRQQSYNTADALTNANAQIAQMVQQGKLAGLQGMGSLGAENAQLGLTAQQAALAGKLNALSGGTSLYGTNPALMNSFMNATQNANSDIAKSLGLSTGYESDLLKLQSGLANNPGDFSIGMGNALGLGKIAGGILGGFGAGGFSPSNAGVLG